VKNVIAGGEEGGSYVTSRK